MNGSLDSERLANLDEFGDRTSLIPAEVKGYFRRKRSQVYTVLIAVFLLLPWVKVGGRQAVLLDIVHREFSFFGLHLYAHDTPLLFLVLIAAIFGIIFATSVWGRVWCGWACPQTVFIDGVFRRIERWTEGDYVKRRAARTQPMTFNRFARRTVKWLLFFAVSSILAHTLIAVFAGAEPLLRMIRQGPDDNSTYFILVSTLTALILFDLGWFREQFCVIACPYGRFQSVLSDSTSLAIIYDEKRGEPRKGSPAAVAQGQAGDCVSCRRCVEVCPTGIDIRRGVQMDCIACTACIDACDEIMRKVKKPEGLIRYDNLHHTGWKLKKARALVPATIVVLSLSALTLILALRSPVDFNLLRNKTVMFEKITDESGGAKILNQFHLHIRNQGGETLEIAMSVNEPGVETATPQNPLTLAPGQDLHLPVFFKFPAGLLNANGEADVVLKLKDARGGGFESERRVHLLGPVGR